MGITTTDCIVCNPHYDCHSTFLLDGDNSSPLLWVADGLWRHMAMVSESDQKFQLNFILEVRIIFPWKRLKKVTLLDFGDFGMNIYQFLSISFSHSLSLAMSNGSDVYWT